jgi:hypothetical protein
MAWEDRRFFVSLADRDGAGDAKSSSGPCAGSYRLG